MKRAAVIVVLLLAAMATQASPYVFDYNNNCSKAYQAYLSMHIMEGRETLKVEAKANPFNLMATYIADYEDCIALLLSCDQAEYDLRESHLDERIDMLEKGDHNSPWYRLCKAGIYLHWGIINMRLGNLYHEAIYFRKSFALLKENKKLFPAFEYNTVFGGLQEAVSGSLPGNYKWLAGLFGLSGSVKTGAAQLAAFVGSHNEQQPLYAEAALYYLFTRFYLLSEQKEAWEYVNSSQFATRGNLLHTFVKTSMALDYRKADAAIETLRNAQTEPNYNDYAVLDYQMGIMLLTKLDTACVFYFERYLKKNKSDILIKDAWQKMAFAWYIAGDMNKANYCRKQAGTQGTARMDADKQAEKFSESNVWPLKKLLQARLLSDGGYYSQALIILNSIDNANLTSPADKAEYYFRLGRVYEETGNSNKGLQFYQSTINAGKEGHEQFAARAALQKGRIYEQSGNNAMAIASYKECLDMPSHDFQNSIDHQAKAGLNRLEGK
jgi:predicted negative regulator of RcsB-dependent stress response